MIHYLMRSKHLEEKIDALNACLQNPECYQEKGLTVLSDELSKLESTL